MPRVLPTTRKQPGILGRQGSAEQGPRPRGQQGVTEARMARAADLGAPTLGEEPIELASAIASPRALMEPALGAFRSLSVQPGQELSIRSHSKDEFIVGVWACLVRGNPVGLELRAQVLSDSIRPECSDGQLHIKRTLDRSTAAQRVAGDLGRKRLICPRAALFRRQKGSEFCFVLHIRADQ